LKRVNHITNTVSSGRYHPIGTNRDEPYQKKGGAKAMPEAISEGEELILLSPLNVTDAKVTPCSAQRFFLALTLDYNYPAILCQELIKNLSFYLPQEPEIIFRGINLHVQGNQVTADLVPDLRTMEQLVLRKISSFVPPKVRKKLDTDPSIVLIMKEIINRTGRDFFTVSLET